MAKIKKIDYTYSVGRRKSASARVRFYKGVGDYLVNGLVIGKYFSNPVDRSLWAKMLKQYEALGEYHASIRVIGGGKHGQLEAVISGIAKSFAKVENGKFRQELKKAGLLTRDALTRERRKVGTGGKARRKKQSPKR